MSFDEKNTWIFLLTSLCGFAVYVLLIALQSGPWTEAEYIAPMLWTVGVAILANIAGRTVIAALSPEDADQRDHRDRETERFGAYVGQSFIAIGGIIALILSMCKIDHFWISNTLYVGFVSSAIFGSMARLAAYRRGVPW
jgi:cell division protein FtsW (lipid II flippase)